MTEDAMHRSPNELKHVATKIWTAYCAVHPGEPQPDPNGPLPMVDAAAMFIAAIDALADYRLTHEEQPK